MMGWESVGKASLSKMDGFVISWVHRGQRKPKKDVLDDNEDETTTFEKC